jgi:hypothetical protein
MKNLPRPFLAPTIVAVLLGLACASSNAARRVSGSSYDGTWSVAIYTLRGNCSSVRVAVRIVGGRVYSEDQSYQSSGSGRLSGNSGAGRWRSSRGECSGTWSAARRESY